MLKNNDYRERVNKIMNEYMDNLRRRESYEMILLSKRWQGVIDTLESLIEELANLPVLSPNKIFQLEVYKQFVLTAQNELLKYSADATKIISATQMEFALAGLQASQETMSLLGVSFNKLPVEAVIKMIGQTRGGSPLSEILLRRYGDNLERVTQILIDSNALGRNPRVTARLMGTTLNTSLSDSLRIARTEQISAFRTASMDGYRESGIVKAVSLITEPTACDECLAVAEKNPYPLDFDFESALHPNCKCSVAPVL